MEYLDGRVLVGDGFIDGYVAVEDGTIVEVSEGRCPCEIGRASCRERV